MSTNKNSILVLALLLLVVGLFFCFSDIEAYGTGSTHPFLTKQIANLYNAIYTPKLTDEQIRQMVEGSVDEEEESMKSMSKKSNTKKKKISKPMPTNEFTCRTCGYEAYRRALFSHCPLCVVCKGCQKEVRKCNCKEGE